MSDQGSVPSERSDHSLFMLWQRSECESDHKRTIVCDSWSGYGLIRGHFTLDSLIIAPFAPGPQPNKKKLCTAK